MKFHELEITKHKKGKRVGRGISAGQGKTAGRGTKGQSSRTGGRRRPGFEGGQTPLMMRMPKLGGFRSFRVKAENVYTGQLNDFAGKTADNFTLAAAGLVTNPYVRVKIVVKGELTSKVNVSVQGASEAAKAMIQKAGGSFTETPQVKRTSTKEAKK
jgi:large subunit ribosomal protein L15